MKLLKKKKLKEKKEKISHNHINNIYPSVFPPNFNGNIILYALFLSHALALLLTNHLISVAPDIN